MSPTFPRRRSLSRLAALLLTAAAVGWSVPATARTDVQALLRRVDELWRGETSHAWMTMRVVTAHYERTMRLEAWSEGQDKSLVAIRAPEKDRGVATLRVENNIWNYLPRINRVTKIPPSMMMGSWMGSHFTNDDLVKESSYADDYDPELTYDGPRDGRDIYEITLVPKPDAPVVWGKVVMVIEKERLIPVVADYFDEDMEKARTLRFTDPTRFGERIVPARLVLQPADKPEESTEIVYESIEFDVPLLDNLFSLRRLRSGRL